MIDILPPGWSGSVFALVSIYTSVGTSTRSLVRRVHAPRFDFGGDPDFSQDEPYPSMGEVKPGTWFAIGTGVIAAIIFVLTLYAFKVILTLCIVEDSPAAYLPVGSEDPSNDGKLKPISALGVNTPRIYVTDSIRGTIRHLRSEAGVFSAWRGSSAHIALIFAIAALRVILRSAFSLFLPQLFAGLAAEILSFLLLARLSMTVTHIIISKNPKNTMWLSRIFATPWSTTRRTLPAMAHFALATTIGNELCNQGMGIPINNCVKFLLITSGALVNLFIAFPIMVALIRVQASLLPNNQEGIISFDRSFGKADCTMGLSFREALKSVGPAGWKRIAKLVMKFWGVIFGLTAIFGALFFIDVFWIIGDINGM